MALNERDMFDYVTGEEKAPNQQAEKEKWKRWRKNDIKAMNSLINSIDPSLTELFLYHDSSKDMWEAIHKHFSKKRNHAHIYHLKKDIHSLSQGNRSMIEYISELKKKWEEFNLYLVKTSDPEIIKEREQEKIYQLLTGLDDSYESSRAQLLLSTDLPNLEDIIALLQQEESRRLIMKSNLFQEVKAESVALATLRSNSTLVRKGKTKKGAIIAKRRATIDLGAGFCTPNSSQSGGLRKTRLRGKR